MSVSELNNQTAQRLNQPLIIMDGFEIGWEKLMDFYSQNQKWLSDFFRKVMS